MRKSGSAPAVPLEGDGGLPLLNFSQIDSYNKCGYKHELSTIRQIQPRTVVRAPEMGSACHAGMDSCVRRLVKKRRPLKLRHFRVIATTAIEKWYNEELRIRGGIECLTPDERAEIEEIMDDAPSIVVRTIGFLDPDRWETLTIKGTPVSEFGIMIPFPGWGGFHCTLDWVARDLEEGGLWLIDYKFRGQFTPEDAEEVNIQMPTYLKVLQIHSGIMCDGSIMLQAKNQAPRKPELLKSGAMSRAAIFSDWPTYRRALLEANLNPADYEEMREKLSEKKFFKLERDYRSPAEIDSVWNNIIVPAGQEMREAKRYLRRMYHMNCNGCKSREFCLAELRGEDTNLLLQTSYVDMNNPAPRLMIRPDDFIVETP